MSDFTGEQYETVLEELRERWTYATTEWQDIRREGAKDMRYIAGDPWEPKDRRAREDAGRPCLALDELGQYANQVINDLRANKRGIKASPVGNGANDKTAAFRQGKIRDAEYRSNAQQAYTVMGENMIQRSYGYLRITPRYVHPDKGFDQELFIDPVVNPDLVTPDPDFLKPDGTDWKYLFYEETRTEKEFNREFPDAEFKSFGPSESALAPGWVNGNKIRIAEYWTKSVDRQRKLLLLKPAGRSTANPSPQPIEIFEDEITGHKPSADQILKTRKVDVLKVTKYLTNGLEVLEETPWLGPSIPFVGCYGKILYIEGKRVILSMTRLARDPYMLYCYYRTQQAEMAGMIPKVPVMGYKGQFAGMEADWMKAPHQPFAFLEAHAKTPESGDQFLPLPTRLAYSAGEHLQALELCAEGARRAIQAAMMGSPLPTSAQRHNEKSGVALKQIEDTAQKGSFHFSDHYDEGVTRTGAIFNESIRFYYDTARETSIRKPDDSAEVVTINDPQAVDKDGKPYHIDTSQGDHDITISVGPAMESERDAASQFADAVVGSKELMMVAGPEKAPKIIAAAIRLKNVGPIGDEMAELFDPKQQDGQPDPKQVLQKVQQQEQQIQQMGQQLQAAAEELKSHTLEIASKEKIAAAQMASAEKIADMESSRRAATAISIAHINASAKGAAIDQHAAEEAQALGYEAEQAERDRQLAVETGAIEHQRTLETGDVEAQRAAAAAEQGQQHALEQGAVGHQQQLEAGDVSHQQALEAGQQAADLAPQPEPGA